MDLSSFEKLVQRALKRLPKKFRDHIRNISIEVEDEPEQDVLDEMGVGEGVLYGLYTGVPITEREWNFGNALPDRILIYQGPIERVAATPEEAEQIVFDTVLHELGHYFGLDDSELYAIEDEKAARNGRREGKKERG